MNLNGIVLEKSLCLLCTGSLAIFLDHKATLPPIFLFSHWMDCATACCGLPKTVRKAKPNPSVEDTQL